MAAVPAIHLGIEATTIVNSDKIQTTYVVRIPIPSFFFTLHKLLREHADKNISGIITKINQSNSRKATIRSHMTRKPSNKGTWLTERLMETVGLKTEEEKTEYTKMLLEEYADLQSMVLTIVVPGINDTTIFKEVNMIAENIKRCIKEVEPTRPKRVSAPITVEEVKTLVSLDSPVSKYKGFADTSPEVIMPQEKAEPIEEEAAPVVIEERSYTPEVIEPVAIKVEGEQAWIDRDGHEVKPTW